MDATAPAASDAEPQLAAVRALVASAIVEVPALLGGDTLQLVAVDVHGEPMPVTWSTSDASVVHVTADGRVYAHSPGSATVLAARKDKSVSTVIRTDTAGSGPTTIAPGENIQGKIDAQPAGTRFTLRAGVHRMQSIVPKNGTVLVGEPGAILSGARLLTAFARAGSLWYVAGQTQEGALTGQCSANAPACRQPEDLFIDDARLVTVSSLAEVRPGTWYFDRAADRAYFADDPTGRKVEISVVTHALLGSATDVLVQNLVVEKYATPAQLGAIHGDHTARWTLDNVEVRHNHGTGVRIGAGMKILRSRVLYNGQLGIGGRGSGVLVDNSEIAFNNTAGYNPAWEAGGTKFARTQDLVVRGNHVHHNQGPGLWTDIDNIRTLYEDNLVEENSLSGIFHEISYEAVIRNNRSLRNGRGSPSWVDGAGILVNSSRGVEIYGNIVEGNANAIAAVQSPRGSGAYGEYRVTNLWVHGNAVAITEGRHGIVQNESSAAVFQDPTNRFNSNHYVAAAGATPFAWNDRTLGFAAWQALGHDTGGSITYR